MNKHTGGEALTVNLKPTAKAPGEVKVVHQLNQPTEASSFPGYSPSSPF